MFLFSSSLLKIIFGKRIMHNFLVIIKPDGVGRGLVGEIISRFEKKGFRIVRMEMILAPISILEEQYSNHRTRPYFDDLIEHFQSGNSLIMELMGNIEEARRMIGDKAVGNEPGSLRGDYSNSAIENLIHCSHSPADASRELNLWF